MKNKKFQCGLGHSIWNIPVGGMNEWKRLYLFLVSSMLRYEFALDSFLVRKRTVLQTRSFRISLKKTIEKNLIKIKFCGAKIMVTFLPYSVSSVGGFIEKTEPKVKKWLLWKFQHQIFAQSYLVDTQTANSKKRLTN